MKLPKKAVKKKAVKKARPVKVSNTAEFWEEIANNPNKTNSQRDRAREMAKAIKAR